MRYTIRVADGHRLRSRVIWFHRLDICVSIKFLGREITKWLLQHVPQKMVNAYGA